MNGVDTEKGVKAEGAYVPIRRESRELLACLEYVIIDAR